MPRAECPKCKKVYHGWGLLRESPQVCPECGAILNISDDSQSNVVQKKPDDSIKEPPDAGSDEV